MVQITPKPIVLKDILMTIGADSYEKQVNGVTFTPAVSQQVWQGLSPTASFTETTTATWTADLAYAQDWETNGSFSRYLHANEGVTAAAVFKPRLAAGSSFSASLVLTPGAIGGAVNTFQEATVTLAVIGKPLEIPAGTGVPIAVSAAPSSGPIAGDTLVIISGAGFTGTTVVKFGAVNAVSFTVLSDTTIVARAPAQAAGSKPILVTNAIGAGTVAAPWLYV